MTAQTKITIKTYFETGDKPTQAQFVDFIDSYQDYNASFTAVTSGATGIVTKASAGGFASRTIEGTANEISVSAGDGATNPVISLPTSITLTGKTLTGGTIVSASITSPSISGNTTSNGSFTGSFFIPTSSAIPTNGLFLPEADSNGFSSNSTYVSKINGTGIFFSRSGSVTTPSASVSGVLIADPNVTSPSISSCGATTTSVPHFQFVNGNGQVGSIATNGTATAYNTSSDYRLKENVSNYTNGLVMMDQLRPVSFNWKADGSPDVGFIAHEVGQVIPKACSGEKDAVNEKGEIVPQGMDASFLIPYLVSAVKELKSRIIALEG